MGVRSLTTFISSHSEYYLVDYTLHDTYLVIDGASVQCQLYWHARGNSCFGGDYDRYARCVADFFDELLKCNVTPLVLFDGGIEDKKFRTALTRAKEKIRRVSCCTPSTQQQHNKCLPLFLKEVFKAVLMEKGIKYAQCIFEGDNVIAAIARILKCPVLSYDSDFFIYGSLYIPFDTLGHRVVRNPEGKGFMKRCKIYRVEKLFQRYKGLNLSLLPLAATLLGNDYVKQGTFKFFICRLALSPIGKRKGNLRHRRIDALFNWLREYSLNQAILNVLSRLPIHERKNLLNIIEKVINSYINTSLSVLSLLDIPMKNFSKEQIQDVTSRTYKFKGDLNKLTYIEETPNETIVDDEQEIKQNEQEIEDDQEIENLLQTLGLFSNESRFDNLPRWFIEEFKQGIYSGYFIDLVTRKLYGCPIQVENCALPSAIVPSLRIINVIYTLLISEVDEKKSNMKYIIRGENLRLKWNYLKYSDDIFGYKLPPLSSLREIPIAVRKEILNVTLDIFDTNCIEHIPSAWVLYVLIMSYWINYWTDQQKDPLEFACYVYSLLFALLFNIIDSMIGFYRILDSFQIKFHKIVENIQSKRKTTNYRPQYSTNVTVSKAIQEVNNEDCLLAASYFLSNFKMDEKLYIQPKRFNVTIVHNFAEFQSCLYHGIHLNALLGFPYEQTKIAKVFNGTLLYNLYSRFQKRDDTESYINQVLQNSPSLARLFNVLLSTVKPLFPAIQGKKVRKQKKPKMKRRIKGRASQENNCEEESAEANEDNNEKPFYDANNPFSLLTVQC